MPRYFFVVPDVDRPVGGVAVSAQMAQYLSDEGYEAAMLSGTSEYTYDFADNENLKYFYYPPLSRVPETFMGRRQKLQRFLKRIFAKRKPPKNQILDLRPDDVFVIPEFWYPEYYAVFPDHKHILNAQHVLSFCTAILRDGNDGGRRFLDQFVAAITISEATKQSVDVFAKRDSFLISQSIAHPDFDPNRPKKRKICYMPRKRVRELGIIENYLKNAPEFDDWELCPIQNMAHHELKETLNESLIFLSFSHEEGFGLPPAEAMAAGCIVIGYTGVGGDEFFDDASGVPILDADITGFAQAINDVIVEYDTDPTRLDKIRKDAAHRISSTYTKDAMRTSLISAWAEIENRLEKPTPK